MGVSRSKLKRKSKEIIIVNNDASDGNLEFNFGQSDQCEPPDINKTEDSMSPTLKWHKANPKDEILKIQREAEIRDIETIYENSCIRKKDFLNLMPDHYWSGMENKLPRYVLYKGDYPDGNKENYSNLRRIKSSSLNDLTESMNLYFNFDEVLINKNQSPGRMFRSVSCPHLQMISIPSLSKAEKNVPIKGILKNRKANRPNSVMIVDKTKENLSGDKTGNMKLVSVSESEYRNQIKEEAAAIDLNGVKMRKKTNISIETRHPCINFDCEKDETFSGYFDQSPSRVQNEKSLKVNVDKKKWIKTNLDKRLNLRPTSMELANRNILHEQNEYDRLNDFEQTRCLLNEKLSERPTLTELKKQKIIKFSDFVEIQETDNYDRSVCKTLGRLTEFDKETIRNELNEFKDKEMKIHSKSKRFTKFHDSNN